MPTTRPSRCPPRRCGIPATIFVATGFLDGGRMFNDSVIETVRRARGDRLDARSAGLDPLPIATLEERRAAIAKLPGAFKYLPVEERQARVRELEPAAVGRLPSDLMMSSAQLRAVHAQGIAIGAHTVSHPILLKLDAQRARSEVDGSRKKLEALLDAAVSLFAYPNGRPGVDYGVEHVRMVKDLGFEAAVSTAWGVCHSGSDRHQLPRFTPWDREIPRFVLRLWHRLLAGFWRGGV